MNHDQFNAMPAPLLAAVAPNTSASPTSPPSDSPSATPTATSSATPQTASVGTNHLSAGYTLLVLLITVAFILLAGLVVMAARVRLTTLGGKSAAQQPPGGQGAAADRAGQPGQDTDRTLIRSWASMSLVGGLLIFVAASFAIDDTTLRSALIGGLVANTGAAVAYYFSSKAADQARQDILNASRATIVVPDLSGKTVEEVNAMLAAVSLRADFSPTPPPADAKVASQYPLAHQQAFEGSAVRVTFQAPLPPPAPAPGP